MKKTLLLLIALLTWMVPAEGSDVDTRIAVNSTTNSNTFAVIIANENYKYEAAVPFALKDGEMFSVYCEKTLGIPPKNIHYVPDATLNNIVHEMEWLEKVMSAYNGGANAIVYYAGHGMPDENDKQAFLLPVDGYSTAPTSGMSTSLLFGQLSAMPARQVVVFIDACFSGSNRSGNMLTSARGVALKAKTQTVTGNVVVFSAAQGSETAYSYTTENHGLFTFFLLQKLQETGGAVTLGELTDYVTDQVKRASIVENGKSQTPTVNPSANAKDWRNWVLVNGRAQKYEERDLDKPRKDILKRDIKKPLNPDVDATSLIEKGKKAVRALRYKEAYKCFKQAADMGSYEGCYQLGLLFNNSNYEDYDKEKATDWMKIAAESEHLDAMYQLGMLYAGTNNDLAKEWLKKAAKKGHKKAKAQYNKLL